VKHSGEFLYKMSNEEDKMNFKISKIRLPEKVKMLEGEDHAIRLIEGSQKETEIELKDQQPQYQVQRLGKRELAPYSKHLNNREYSIITQ
jgi:hypothetical protein